MGLTARVARSIRIIVHMVCHRQFAHLKEIASVAIAAFGSLFNTRRGLGLRPLSKAVTDRVDVSVNVAVAAA